MINSINPVVSQFVIESVRIHIFLLVGKDLVLSGALFLIATRSTIASNQVTLKTKVPRFATENQLNLLFLQLFSPNVK